MGSKDSTCCASSCGMSERLKGIKKSAPTTKSACRTCGVEYQRKTNNQKYCSASCKARFVDSIESYLKRLLSKKERSLLSLDGIVKLIEQNDFRCALTGLRMNYKTGGGTGGASPLNVSIDRIDPIGGYVMSNIRIVCVGINSLRKNMTDEQLLMFCKGVVETIGPLHE